jgi:hypothetical protein
MGIRSTSSRKRSDERKCEVRKLDKPQWWQKRVIQSSCLDEMGEDSHLEDPGEGFPTTVGAFSLSMTQQAQEGLYVPVSFA